jgi:hypothetical protein
VESCKLRYFNSFELFGHTGVMIPLRLLGNPGRAMNFKVTVSSEIEPCGYTGVLDYMPNVGLPPGRTVPR